MHCNLSKSCWFWASQSSTNSLGIQLPLCTHPNERWLIGNSVTSADVRPWGHVTFIARLVFRRVLRGLPTTDFPLCRSDVCCSAVPSRVPTSLWLYIHSDLTSRFSAESLHTDHPCRLWLFSLHQLFCQQRCALCEEQTDQVHSMPYSHGNKPSTLRAFNCCLSLQWGWMGTYNSPIPSLWTFWAWLRVMWECTSLPGRGTTMIF